MSEPTFEEAYRELEEIVGRLERGDVPLDEALELWRRGETAYRLCLERLTAAESRIEELSPRPDGTSGDGL
ncbi:MAG TPA: exodeoxyribonuclease VII small subunit [Gaiella sp.]|jgi:exodeoxyribonuclease VII small subunit